MARFGHFFLSKKRSFKASEQRRWNVQFSPAVRWGNEETYQLVRVIIFNLLCVKIAIHCKYKRLNGPVRPFVGDSQFFKCFSSSRNRNRSSLASYKNTCAAFNFQMFNEWMIAPFSYSISLCSLRRIKMDLIYHWTGEETCTCVHTAN
jgi:hypothetical protein